MRARPWKSIRIDAELLEQVAVWAAHDARDRAREGLPRRTLAGAVAYLLARGLRSAERRRKTRAGAALVSR